MKTFIRTTLAFLFMVAVPQLVQANDLAKASDTVKADDLTACLQQIEQSWPMTTQIALTGETRHKTSCQLALQQTGHTLNVMAVGNPLHIQFTLGIQTPEVEQSLLSCRVDNEKIHIVFEEKHLESFERRDRIQLTLLKRHGTGFSMILSKKEMKLLRPTQQSNLICHLGS